MKKQPVILIENQYSLHELESLKKDNTILKITDIYLQQLKELFEITFPSLRSLPPKEYEIKLSEFIKSKTNNIELSGNWIYFSWNGQLVHMVNEQDYLLLRTNRNKNLITESEQQNLYDACIAVVGLSVGSATALGLTALGIANRLKLAEYDILETTNLNRMRAGVYHIGSPKLDIVTQQIYEINPYSELSLFDKGLHENNLNDFLNKDLKPRVIFEAIDDFKMKIKLRLSAKACGIPVIMLTNLGDSILVDIERYDLDKDLQIFNGLLGDLPEQILNMPNDETNKYAIGIVGRENIPERALESVKEINKTLVGRPQLFSTVSISGALATYFSRRIILGKELLSGRMKLSIHEVFNLTSLVVDLITLRR